MMRNILLTEASRSLGEKYYLASMGGCESDTVKVFDVKTVGKLNFVCAFREIEIYKLLKRVSFSTLFYKNK